MAMATGMLYRLGLAFGYTAGLELGNIRHAHSHTMYFGWVTPVLFLLIGFRTGLPRLRQLAYAALASAALAYPLFLAFGYSIVRLGSVEMPISVVAATLNTVVWYLFVFQYFRFNRGAERSPSGVLWDVALAFLLLATVGALGLALLKPLGVESMVWPVALTHIFLDLFSEGWFVLAVVGLAYVGVESPPKSFSPAVLAVTLGLPFTFAMGIPHMLVSAPLEIAARTGSALVGAGLLMHVAILWRRAGAIWRFPLALLAIKALGQLASAAAVGFWIADYHGLRVLYLHIMLLGFVTCGLVAAATSLALARESIRPFFNGAVLVLLASILPLTELFPAGWRGSWALYVAAFTPLIVIAFTAGLALSPRE